MFHHFPGVFSFYVNHHRTTIILLLASPFMWFSLVVFCEAVGSGVGLGGGDDDGDAGFLPVRHVCLLGGESDDSGVLSEHPARLQRVVN